MAKYICDGFKYVGGLTRQNKRSFYYYQNEKKLEWRAPGGEMKGQMILTKVEKISEKQFRFHGIRNDNKEPRDFVVTISSDCLTGFNNLKQMGVVFVSTQTAGRKRKTRKRHVRKSGRKTGKRRGRKSRTRRNKKHHNKKRRTRRRR